MNQVIAGYRHKAGKKGREYVLTKPQFLAIAKRPCFYCGGINSNLNRSPHGTGDFAYNGLDKINPSKGYTINNTVAACRRCNLAKSDRAQGQFIDWIKKCHDYLKLTAMAEQWG